MTRSCVYVMIDNNTNIEHSIAKVLEPFRKNREVPPYRVYLSHDAVVALAKESKLPPAHLNELCRQWEACSGKKCGVDRYGLYSVSTSNPDGRWEAYEFGGMWARFRGDSCCIKASVLAKPRNRKYLLPFHLVTPEGEWLEHRREYRVIRDGVPTEIYECMEHRQWSQLVKQMLLRWPDHYVILIDIITETRAPEYE